MIGMVACTALTALDLSGCKIMTECASVRALAQRACGMRARLLSLALDGNHALRTQGVCDVLAVPSLRGLTRLSLVSVVIQPADDDSWPWQQLCTLTALQELRLADNFFGKAGANECAKHLSELVQLRRLDISACGIIVAGTIADELCRLPQLQQLACRQFGRKLFEVPAAFRTL